MNHSEMIDYWIDSSDKDYETMKVLMNNAQYSWSLFVGHLVVEKLLKALYIKENENVLCPPKTHSLLSLAEKCKLELEAEQIEKLQIITQFNISARYDDYKQEFYKKCTSEYTKLQVKNIEEIREWLKEKLIMKS